MKRWSYYNHLAWLDIIRLWPSVQQHVIIVAGICLPILLLLGLRNGHIRELRKVLVTSPTGREVGIWLGNTGKEFTEQSLEKLRSEIAGVELAIPAIERVVDVSRVGADGVRHLVQFTTLKSTRSGDPRLKQQGADAIDQSGQSEPAIVLARGVAKELQAKPGDRIIVTVSRRRGEAKESATVEMVVGALFDPDEPNASEAFASVATLLEMERYVNGSQVPRFNWPAFNVPAPFTFAGYLLFSKRGDELDAGDLESIDDRGLAVHKVTDTQRRGLYGLLKADSLENLDVSYITLKNGQTDALWGSCNLSPGTVAGLTDRQDVAIPWNGAKQIILQGKPLWAIGLMLPKISWFKQHLLDPTAYFPVDAETFAVLFPGDEPFEKPVTLKLDDHLGIQLNARSFANKPAPPKEASAATPPAPPAPAPAPAIPTSGGTIAVEPAAKKPPELTKEPDPPDDVPSEAEQPVAVSATAAESKTEAAPAKIDNAGNAGLEPRMQQPPPAIAIVPMDLLAYLYAYEAKRVEFDKLNNLFVEVPSEPKILKARLYATTIDDVPSVVANFKARGYAVDRDLTKISEIHQQTRSLSLLVLIVGIGVFLFGVVTVVSVLLDSTERKRGTLGILRVMGVSRAGIFYTVVLRAGIIACLAAIVTIAVGFAIAAALAWQPPPDTFWASYKPVVQVVIGPRDLIVVVLGALACCGMGALIPAYRASKLDPFDAIVEGRFR